MYNYKKSLPKGYRIEKKIVRGSSACCFKNIYRRNKKNKRRYFNRWIIFIFMLLFSKIIRVN